MHIASVPIVRLRTLFALAAIGGCGVDAPPKDAARAPLALEGAAATVPSAHDSYAAAGISCETCHPCGAAAVHEAAWMDRSSAGFHATSANRGLSGCQSCHGADLEGTGSARLSCTACHGTGWTANCTMCHGGTDNGTGAPPRASWGNEGDATRTGTHSAHVTATHGLAQAVPCEVCHVRPQTALSEGHLDGETATVIFSGLAVRSGITPSWDRAAATCSSTYCHGATLAGGRKTAPVWTLADGSQRTCDSCHGAPPANAFHTRRDLDCASCHPAGNSAAGASVGGGHLDGMLDVTLSCTSCHGDPRRPRASGAATSTEFSTSRSLAPRATATRGGQRRSPPLRRQAAVERPAPPRRPWARISRISSPGP